MMITTILNLSFIFAFIHLAFNLKWASASRKETSITNTGQKLDDKLYFPRCADIGSCVQVSLAGKWLCRFLF